MVWSQGLWLAAEHGAEWKSPSAGSWDWLRPQVTSDWNTVTPILEHFVDRTPGSFEEEKKYGLVWHYSMPELEFGEGLANELVSMLEATSQRMPQTWVWGISICVGTIRYNYSTRQ